MQRSTIILGKSKLYRSLVTASVMVILMGFMMVSCEKTEPAVLGPNPGTGSEMSSLTVIMHDTAGPYSAVNVEIIEAEVHVADSNDTTWMPLSVNAGVYNLLELQNGIDTVLASQTLLPAGYLSQLRLILGDSNSVVLNDSVTTYPLKTPSGQQSGVKILINDSLEANVAYGLVLDFDANESVVQTGNNKYLLKPVIKVDSLYEQ